MENSRQNTRFKWRNAKALGALGDYAKDQKEIKTFTDYPAIDINDLPIEDNSRVLKVQNIPMFVPTFSSTAESLRIECPTIRAVIKIGSGTNVIVNEWEPGYIQFTNYILDDYLIFEICGIVFCVDITSQNAVTPY